MRVLPKCLTTYQVDLLAKYPTPPLYDMCYLLSTPLTLQGPEIDLSHFWQLVETQKGWENRLASEKCIYGCFIPL